MNESRDSSIQQFLDNYLSEGHVNDVAEGCALASLGGDVSREADTTRLIFKQRAYELACLLSSSMVTGNAKQREAQAWTMLSAAIGGLILARSLGKEEGAKVMESIKATFDSGSRSE